ncbi:DUF2247 family protein [Cryobacterium sp. MDB1-18-2]|uniref:DUF2247 family protein n=1 Tax=unclassified Cryobacterium TaxID=2649013 RepID=UPI00106AFA95|nr:MULTISPECIES: DUF2247 family protein [unclassified Cryobacterium]TFC22113.1 DUF2247 family protein [Cryobacterium sp. MDB1-18-2]TFC40686.1 DUF2247 family protein [Cryobacterium sp. MDB1-18-1]
MSDDLVKFAIPAEFVTARVLVTPGELVHGYRHGWLSDRAVVDVALAAFDAGAGLPSAVEELALLLSDDLGRAPELVEDLARSSVDEPNPGEVWLFLALAWVFEHRSEYLEPFEVVEMLYADFDYPEEIEGLVRFMPRPQGSASRYGAIEQRWDDFVSRKSAQYRARGSQPALAPHNERGHP